ncbi:uncharacterized protein LOC111605048 [Drosophila hydei]|uniref:Uncharacterized protein LOC111605048 n=1 Tax=Drosophila hydei TaxID=7224 RepID=A0A6J2SSF3_DROHY|nr:uncharacterized protein LOC111605048 [Drosophila hydei]
MQISELRTSDIVRATSTGTKFCIIALALLGLVAADVSHLLNVGQNSGYSYGSSASSSSSSSASAVLPGGDSSSYQPEHLIPQNLQVASAQIVAGGDSSSYQAAHVLPQSQVASAQIIPGGDSSSYQPEHLIPQNLKVASAQIVAGGDSSSYQTAHVLPQSQVASAQIIPGGDSSSYQPEHLIPQNLKVAQVGLASAAVETESYNIGADTYTPEQFIPEADRIAHAAYGQQQQQQQQQAQVVIGANTVTPAQLYQEPTSNGIEELNTEARLPVAYTATSASSSGAASFGTQYGSNGGYVY